MRVFVRGTLEAMRVSLASVLVLVSPVLGRADTSTERDDGLVAVTAGLGQQATTSKLAPAIVLQLGWRNRDDTAYGVRGELFEVSGLGHPYNPGMPGPYPWTVRYVVAAAFVETATSRRTWIGGHFGLVRETTQIDSPYSSYVSFTERTGATLGGHFGVDLLAVGSHRLAAFLSLAVAPNSCAIDATVCTSVFLGQIGLAYRRF